jgi:hypothetical protein
MFKKLSLMMAAVAVLAFAVPAVASAASLTEGSTELAVGARVVGTGTDIILTSNLLGTITCEKITLKGTVTQNSGGVAKGSGVAEKPGQTGCRRGTNEVIVTSVTLNELFTNTTESYVSFETTLDIGPTECTYVGTKVKGTVDFGTDLITFSEATGVAGKQAACGTAKLDGTFTLETENGTPIIINS